MSILSKFISVNNIGFGFTTLLVFSSSLYASAIEEVVVTASKRGEINIQDLPQSIFALSGDSMEARNQVNFEDFAGSVPGLQYQDLGPGDKEYIIRGINGTGPSVVGAYVDEYVISASDSQDGGGKNAPLKMIDIERVEVLNGPQGTLYGANSMAGNIRFITRKPKLDGIEGNLNLDVSGTSEGGENFSGSAVINLPLIENVLGIRAVLYGTSNDGWIDQPRGEQTVGGATTFDNFQEDINDEETIGGRIALRWTPIENLTIDGMYLLQELETGGSPRFTARGTPGFPDVPAEFASLPAGFSFAPLAGLNSLTPTEDFVNTDILNSPRDDDVELFGGTITYEQSYGTYSVAASHYNHDIVFNFDTTPLLLFFGVPVPTPTVEPQSYETTMVEGRFASSFDGPVNFVAGVYYQKDENDFEVQSPTTDGNGNALPWDPSNSNDAFTTPGGTAIFGRFRLDEIEQKAIFGEVTYEFSEQWSLLAGFRYFQVDLESRQATTHGFLGQVIQPAGEIIGTTVNGNGIGLIKEDDDTIRPKFSLSYQHSDDLLLYGQYSEGFRVGGVNNANQPFAPGIPATYDSDELTNIEFGFKSEWHDGRVRLNAALFLIDWENIQIEARDPAVSIPFITNGGEAGVNGLEWSLQALLSDSLELTFSGTYFFKHELTQDQPQTINISPIAIVGRDGDELPNIPEFQAYASLRYNTQLFGKNISLIGDLTYRGSVNTEFVETDVFNLRIDDYAILDLFANMDITQDISVGLYAKNVTNSLAIVDAVHTFQDPFGFVAARPRTVGITANWKF